ncbi:MAG: M20/M25/M40 family metallo-hydrolase [Chitinophagales bacterium]
MRKTIASLLFILLAAAISAQENVNLDMIGKIKKEGTDNSKVMEIAFYLTDVSGPRLTGSPGFTTAANWAKNKLTDWGLVNAQLDPWGEFGKSWRQERCYVAMTSPYYQPLIAIPRAWTGSTPGKKEIKRDVVLIKAMDTVELMKYAGKIKDKIVMTWSTTQLKPSFEADGNRYADTTLDKMANARPQGANRGGQGGNRFQGDSATRAAFFARNAVQRKMTEFFLKERPALVLSMNASGNDGTLFVSSGGSYTKDAAEAPANVTLSSDDYLRLQRLVEAGIKVELEADVKTKFFSDDLKGYNVIAEIPGTDPALKDEVVMLGGHLDSWHAATGATDNAAGCSVMMEAVRILKSLGVQPRRTIRIALWSGEEQGLYGSRNYVKNHVADTANGKWVFKEQPKITAYFNLDNGTGKIRGVYMQGNEGVRPIFAKWLEPFSDLGAKTLTINNTGGTDHLSFDRVGVPGFQFIQDEIEYDTRTHHTNMDSYDHLIPEDLKQASVIVASFVYNAAMRDEKLPRKELAQPTTTQRGF